MAYELKDDQVTIFKNDKKGNDKAPDYRGTALIDGVEREVSLWVKEAKSGIKYFNGSIKRKEQQQRAQTQQRPQRQEPASDDLPF